MEALKTLEDELPGGPLMATTWPRECQRLRTPWKIAPQVKGRAPALSGCQTQDLGRRGGKLSKSGH